jgi:hypothetical protein
MGAAGKLEQYAPLGHRQALSSSIVSRILTRPLSREKSLHTMGKKRMETSRASHQKKCDLLPVKESVAVSPLHQPHPSEAAPWGSGADVGAAEERDELSALLSDIVHHVERLIFK